MKQKFGTFKYVYVKIQTHELNYNYLKLFLNFQKFLMRSETYETLHGVIT